MTARHHVPLILAAALGSAVAFFPVVASAQQQTPPATQKEDAGQPPSADDQEPRHHLTQEDKEAFLDARFAAVHAGLKLSSDQEKLWPPVESAIRDAIAQARDARQKMRAAADTTENEDPIARMRQRAEWQLTRAQNMIKITGAAEPLYASLSDDQKWRLHALLRAIHWHRHMGRERDGDRHEDGDGHQDGEK